MAFHLSGWRTGALAAGTNQALAALADSVLGRDGTTGYVPTEDLRLLAAYASSAYLQAARVNSTGLQRVGYQYIRPATVAALPASPPNLAVLLDNPVVLRASEAITIEATTSGGTADAIALLWTARNLEVAPPGEAFWLRYISADAVTANQWSPVTLAQGLSDPLPAGTYAIVGLEHWCPGGVAARLVLPGGTYRPGVLAINGSPPWYNGRSHDIFYQGALGVFGWFQSTAPPSIEVLSTSADNAHQGYIKVIRVGGLDAFRGANGR